MPAKGDSNPLYVPLDENNTQYVLDNYAYDIIGSGSGGVTLDEYTDRCEALKRQASEYVTENGQRQAALVGEHTSGLLALFGDSKVSQSLFIGYIVSAVTAHDVDWYSSRAWAFWGIQLRAIVAVLGVATLAISGGIQSQVNQIQSVPGYSKLDGRGITQTKQVAWVFMRNCNTLRYFTRACGTLVLVTFVLGFLLDLKTMFADNIDLTFTWVCVLIIALASIGITCWLRSEGSKAMGSMGYSVGECGFHAVHAGNPMNTTTYTTGLPQPIGGAGSARRRHYVAGGYVAGGASLI